MVEPVQGHMFVEPPEKADCFGYCSHMCGQAIVNKKITRSEQLSFTKCIFDMHVHKGGDRFGGNVN